MSRIRYVVLGLTAVSLLGCETSIPRERLLPTAPQKDEAVIQDAAAASLWAAQVVDTTGPGASYAMFVPQNWDATGRTLMIFAHGLVYPAFPVALPNINGVRDALGAKGYAVAYSSYSENGWAVKDGAERTHQLRGLFTDRFGAPGHTFLYGRSLGGLIGIMLAEKFPNQYDGVLAECPASGGSTNAFKYLFDVRRLFDYFYPGVVPGNALGVPADWNPSPADSVRADFAMQADMSGALTIAKLDQTPIQFASPVELRAAIIDILTVHVFEVNDIMQRSHGDPPVSSSAFTSADPSVPLASINANTLAFDSAPDGANFAAHEYDPTGNLRIPVLTMTTSRDPRLPAPMNELAYERSVAAAGHSDMLRHQEVARYGHCTFTGAERVAAFLNLVSWAQSLRP